MSSRSLVVVSGGTKGIGKAVLEAFAGQGFDLVTCSRSQEDLEALKVELESRFDVVTHIFQADLSKKEEALAFADFALLHQQPIAVLVNNSGVFLPGEVHTETDGALELQLATNVESAYHMARELIPEMKKQGYGHIFNVCSTASITAYTNGGSYCISKYALYGFSKVLREEMKPFNIRVTSVLPGATLTNSWAGTDLPEERFMPPEDVAQMMLCTFNLSERTVVEDLLMRPILGDL
ncbi:SDR family oxidoreductase [Halioxenophilus sp. WMMB6]|uniref:SDR family NAD(P)-dependent oxidoreductase n=1 Tax=Halioxenophilus sp. WMMB6 TaxID=3073815 RepID=UPI00295F21F2|nr:SDR family oxidoreductase [Halioxenophilus sp. WMMB6]